MVLLGVLAGALLYFEVVFHLGCFGFLACNPVFTLTLVLTLASVETFLICLVRGKWKSILYWLFLIAEYILFAVQMVYMGIFKQPLLWQAVIYGGQDSLTNYWRETLEGILNVLPFLLLLLVFLVAAGLLFAKKREVLFRSDRLVKIRAMLSGVIGIVLAVAVMLIGKHTDADYYEHYSEFYDPLTVMSEMGVLTTAQRDTALNLKYWSKDIYESVKDNLGNSDTKPTEEYQASEEFPQDVDKEEVSGGDVAEKEETASSDVPETEEIKEEEPGADPEPELPDTSPNQLPIDFTMLKAAADGKETEWLAEYIETLEPTKRNEYTGLFKDHNLIFITAEGFSPYAVREELAPTLYRLIHSGFDFTNYYTPLWQTSTSDGEYVNLTGLIPDGQFSMRKSGSNNMSFALPGYFADQGVGSMAYHNNSLSYYNRHLSHNNLGYLYKASKLGDLSAEEWGQYIFPMEGAEKWPASDFEMVRATMPEYLDWERFNVYYLTVSGHMNYNFIGNSMARKNQAAVEHLEMSETARAYLACQMELENALVYLIEQLEAAGKLENTVICLSADHYPYGMPQENYEELAGRSLSGNMDMYRNDLILWNVKLEENPQVIEKVCGPVDILPTLLNLFGFEYDSRLYAGRDIFSEEEGLVIFSDRSFVTDHVIYDRKAKETVWKDDVIPSEEQELYLEYWQKEVKDRYQLSAYILRNDYYARIQEALPEEYRNNAGNPARITMQE